MRQRLRPMFDRIVVRELDPPDMRASGLVVPRTDYKPPQEGIVVAVGDGKDWWAQAAVEMPVGVGDHVVFPYQCGVYIEVNEERLLVLLVHQLIGVLEDDPEPPTNEEMEKRLRGWQHHG